MSKLDLAEDKELTLKEVVESDPGAFLGKKHVQKYGSQLAVLVKVLDSSERLTVQTHPDRTTAKRLFDSEFGKTEAWLILGGRSIDGEEPYLLLGFKPGMTKEKWRRLFEEQDTNGMLSSLHKIPLKKDKVYLIEGGVPPRNRWRLFNYGNTRTYGFNPTCGKDDTKWNEDFRPSVSSGNWL